MAIICIIFSAIDGASHGAGTVGVWKIKCSALATIRSLTERVHVWTSTALGSNNCILAVSKHGILPVLCRAEPSCFPVKGRF